MTINEIQNEIVEEFELFDNKNDQYNYIIELGKKLAPFPEAFKTETNLIKGCQSQVWVKPRLEGELLFFDGDSDSVLVKGLVSLLVRVLSGRNAKEIAETDLFFVDKIGLKQMLSMNRANGLGAMIKQLKLYAVVISQK